MDSEQEPSNEMDTFLPQREEGREDLLNNSTKVIIVPAQKKEYQNGVDKSSLYDPFKLRTMPNATTDSETLAHLLKACLGTGVLAMPYAFRCGGVLFSVVMTVVVGIICAHCSYILVKCAHILYHRLRIPSLTFPEIGEVAFANGPSAVRIFAKPARLCIIIGVFLTYFGTCCAYSVVIAKNLQEVIQYYKVWDPVDGRYYIAALVLPLLLLSYVPDLKKLAICSQIANVLIALTIGITFYYIFFGKEKMNDPVSGLPHVANWELLPEFFSITIFAIECIGVVMPLENNMKKPKHFLGTCGIMNIGMTAVTAMYLIVGLFGYLNYGENSKDVITLNLPEEEIGSQCAKIFVAVAVFFTFGLQFYVCLEIVWNGVKHKVTKNSTLVNYLLRSTIVLLAVMVAIAVPQISPFLTIIGALFFSSLGLLFPAILEILVFWEEGFGFAGWRLIKNIIIIIFGLMAVVFGTRSGINQALHPK